VVFEAHLMSSSGWSGNRFLV